MTNLLEYIIYDPLPDYYQECFDHNKSKGWVSTELTTDNYDINIVKPFHCGFKHIKQITIPKINKIKDKIDGIFIIEGDVKISIDYDEFLKMNIKVPTWLGYKKHLSNYIVGNFLIFIPMSYWEQFVELVDKQKRNIYSDRFFTKLYFNDFLKLSKKTIANEVLHYSNVLKGWRY